MLTWIQPQLFDMLHDPFLQRCHAFAIRRAGASTPLIPLPPTGVRREPGELHAGPPTHVELVEGRYDFNREIDGRRHDHC